MKFFIFSAFLSVISLNGIAADYSVTQMMKFCESLTPSGWKNAPDAFYHYPGLHESHIEDNKFFKSCEHSVLTTLRDRDTLARLVSKVCRQSSPPYIGDTVYCLERAEKYFPELKNALNVLIKKCRSHNPEHHYNIRWDDWADLNEIEREKRHRELKALRMKDAHRVCIVPMSQFGEGRNPNTILNEKPEKNTDSSEVATEVKSVQ